MGEHRRFHPSGFSRFAAKSSLYPNPKLDPEAFYAWLCEMIVAEKCDVIFPMSDDVMNVVVPRQEDLRRLCQVPVPPEHSYDVARDKGETLKLAEAIGIPFPKTLWPNLSRDWKATDLLDLVRDFDYPMVVKPRLSFGSRGIRIVNNDKELIEVYGQVHKEHLNPLIQEKIPTGSKYDVCLLYGPDHHLKAQFVQREVRNYPLERGPSTLRQSVDAPELLQYALQLMDQLPWYGALDVEFMVDPRTNEPKLMEINPRFWGSLHLSIQSGVDFPWLLLQLALGKAISPVCDYKSGQMSRSLLPGDLMHYLFNFKKCALDPSFFDLTVPDDLIQISDLKPVLGFLLSLTRYLFDPKAWHYLKQIL